MTCPNCGEPTKVTNTAAVYGSVLRRRKCSGCGYIFFTEELEVIEEDGTKFRKLLNAKRRGEIE